MASGLALGSEARMASKTADLTVLANFIWQMFPELGRILEITEWCFVCCTAFLTVLLERHLPLPEQEFGASASQKLTHSAG